MIKKVLFLTGLIGCWHIVTAQEHVHGQGQMVIAQEDNNWHVQFILPAADVLGFEHAPENEAQQKTVQLFAKRLEANNAIIKFDLSCTLTEVTHSLLLDQSTHNKKLNHHEANNETFNLRTSKLGKHTLGQHKRGQNKHGEHDEVSHEDVEAEYHFVCASHVTNLSVTLFEGLTSLSSIRAQWITNEGQGMAQLTPASPYLAW